MINLAEALGFPREHRFARRHISEYLDGELTHAQAARVEKHVRFCPHCHRLLSGLRRTVAALGELREHAQTNIADSVIDRLRAEL